MKRREISFHLEARNKGKKARGGKTAQIIEGLADSGEEEFTVKPNPDRRLFFCFQLVEVENTFEAFECYATE